MHYRQALNTIHQALTIADRLGASLPKEIRAEYLELTELGEKIRRLDYGDGGVSEAVVNAVAANKDVSSDEAVASAVARYVIATHANGIEDTVGRRAVDFLERHAETILAGFAKPFEGYAAAIVAATDKFGSISPDDTSTILSKGGDAAQVWADAQTATENIAAIRRTWKSLSTVSSKFGTDPRYTTLTIADIPPAEYLEQGISGWLTPWELARRGFPLSLATPTVYRQRREAVQAQSARRTAAQADEFREAYHRTHGMGPKASSGAA